ncbi:MAG: hypothetical protein ACLRQF_04130 [Thomasclavelia ramosa]
MYDSIVRIGLSFPVKVSLEQGNFIVKMVITVKCNCKYGKLEVYKNVENKYYCY